MANLVVLIGVYLDALHAASTMRWGSGVGVGDQGRVKFEELCLMQFDFNNALIPITDRYERMNYY
jgi:hypothetical protein